MPTNANLPAGASLTSIDGRRCTAVPRSANAQPGTTTQQQQQETTTTTTPEQQQTTLQTTTTTQAEQTTSTEEVATSSTASTTSSTTSTSTTSTSTSTIQEEQTSTPARTSPPPQQTVEQPPPPPPILSEPESTTTAVAANPAITTANQVTSPSQAPGNARGGGGSSSGGESSVTDSATSALTESSQTDPIQTAPTSPATTATFETPLAETEGTSTGTALTTTIGTAEGTAGAGASAEADQPTITAVASDSSNTERTIAIVGGVVGGIAVASLIAFLLWFWRKKLLKRRRSTLLTPLSTDESFAKGEKSYVIDRRSVGPTPRTERIRADLSYGFSRVRGRLSTFLGRRADSPTPSVNLNRGNSQFIDPVPPHSRSSSRGSSRAGLRGGKLTTKDRLVDWWDRLTEDINFNWKLRNEQAAGASMLDPFTSSAARSVKEKNTALAGSGQPDFLTLLGMDDKQLEREASLRRRDSRHGHNNSSSSDHFLGGLGLNFDGRDPFADTSAADRDSAKPGPLVVSQPGNPFADTNAVPAPPMPSVPKPTTYVHEIRRSRGSVSDRPPPAAAAAAAAAAAGVSGLPSHFGTRQSRADSYRESLVSVESFATRRNKFRSDPFDLEQPELLLKRTGGARADPAGAVGMNGSISGSAEYFDAQEYVRLPRHAHTRNDSFTSKYSSGLTLGDWSDPGPDVGPAAGRSWDGSEGVGGAQANPNSRPQGRGQGSQGSVGKAL